MPATPEVPKVPQPEIQEINKEAEFIVPETLRQDTGVQVVQKNFKAQVNDDHGNPIIETPPTQVITVTPPGDTETLITQSKGDTSLSTTWLATFWLRIIKKAIFFGWKIIGKEKKDAIA